MGWVVDTSMALAWGLPDEESPSADEFWREVIAEVSLHVPSLWWYECANALVVARRWDRLTAEEALHLGTLLAALPLNTAASPVGHDLSRLQRLAGKHGLSAYDAAYLDLADRLGVGLATLDGRLAEAAHAEDIRVYAGQGPPEPG
jgi:predicted nucleic acid-binding protein